MRVNRSILAAALTALAATPATALDFVFTYPPNIDPQALAGFQAAAARWQANFTDPITVRVNIDFSSTLPDGVLGATNTSRLKFQYNNGANTILPRLIADATSPDDQVAVASLQTGRSLQFLINHTTSNGGNVYLDNNGSANNNYLLISTANAKALNLLSGQASEGNSIQFSSKFTWDFNPRDGITPGAYDFVGLATHELAHVLGFLSGVDLLEQNTKDAPRAEDTLQYVNTLDLFRYSDQSRANGPGVFDLSADTRAKYFSIDGGTTSIANFATGAIFGDGSQASHWKQTTGNTPSTEVMVPAARTGQTLLITDTDRCALDVIGYDRNFTWKWAGGAAGSWHQPLNWNAVGVPTSAITAGFDAGGTTPVVVSLDDAASAAGLQVTSDNVTVNLSGRNLSVGGSIQIGDAVSKTGALTITGPGSVTVGDSIYVGGTSQGAGGTGSLTIGPDVAASVAMNLHIYSGAGNVVNLNGGSLSAGHIYNEGVFTASSGTLTVGNSFTNTGTARLGGVQHWAAGSVLSNAGGTLTLASDTGSATVAGPALIVSGGAAYLQTVQHLSDLNISGGAVSVSGGQPLITHGLAVSGAGRLDLGTSDMILFYGGDSPLASVESLVATGRIYSSVSGLVRPTTIAVLDNTRLHMADWCGEPLSGVSGDFRELILKMTYVGDTNLDGTVTQADLQNVVAHLNQPGTWIDGDVDQDGRITLADYNLVYLNLGAGDGGRGGPSLLSADAFQSVNTSLNMVVIPEPAELPLLAGCLVVLWRRRRRTA
ncbi:MAG: NF038122 family metalloprotease [Tepidisphaerales bacterium]